MCDACEGKNGNSSSRLGAVARACNPSYLGGGDWEDRGEQNVRPYLNKQTGHGSVHL
jgi:hypothetical protein